MLNTVTGQLRECNKVGLVSIILLLFFFFKQKTAYEIYQCDWSSDVCSSDLAEDILELLAKVDLRISKHELSAFFRKPGHKHYRECKDQVLRNFLNGLQLKYRP